MNTSIVIYGYKGLDVLSLLSLLLNVNSNYIIKYNADNSQVIITRQDNVKETN